MTRDEFLTRAQGRCWHEWENDEERFDRKCRKCGVWQTREQKLDFVTILLWSQDDARTYVPQGGPEKWTWKDFHIWASNKHIDAFPAHAYMMTEFSRWLFNPERFAGVLAEYLGWREP